jgi:hypothetical protein
MVNPYLASMVEEFTEEEVKTFNLTAELNSCKLLYLYGLPNEPEPVISSVEKRIFWVRYLVLKVKYERIGTDSWYFYFDPKLML